MIVAMTTMKRREHFEIGPGRVVWTGTPYSDDRHNDPMPPTRETFSPWVVFPDPDVGLAARSNEHEASPRQGLNATNAKEIANAVVSVRGTRLWVRVMCACGETVRALLLPATLLRGPRSAGRVDVRGFS